MNARSRIRHLPPAEWHRAVKPLGARTGRGQFILEKWIERVRFFGCRCWVCGLDLSWVELTPRGVFSDITADHVVRRSMGGMDFVSNLRPCCSKCNFTDERPKSIWPPWIFGGSRNLPALATDEGNSYRTELLSRPGGAVILAEMDEIAAELKTLRRELQEHEESFHRALLEIPPATYEEFERMLRTKGGEK